MQNLKIFRKNVTVLLKVLRNICKMLFHNSLQDLLISP